MWNDQLWFSENAAFSYWLLDREGSLFFSFTPEISGLHNCCFLWPNASALLRITLPALFPNSNLVQRHAGYFICKCFGRGYCRISKGFIGRISKGQNATAELVVAAAATLIHTHVPLLCDMDILLQREATDLLKYFSRGTLGSGNREDIQDCFFMSQQENCSAKFWGDDPGPGGGGGGVGKLFWKGDRSL